MSEPDTHQPSDAEVIQASLAEPDAFAPIFDRHFNAVYGYLARRGGAGLADDLTGQVFETAFTARRTFDLDRASARPWLYGIALNTLRRHRRTATRRGAAYRRLLKRDRGIAVDDLGEVDGAVDADRRSPALQAGLAALHRRDREPLLLHVWEDLSYAEVAEALGIPIGTVRSRVHRARTRLRASLGADTPVPPVRGRRELSG